MKRPLLRDILFYLTTTTLVWSTFLARKILLTHSIIFIITYSIYVIVVIVSGYIYKRRQRSLKAAAHTNHAIEYNGAKMPRENLHRQTKYVVNKNDNDQTTNTESTSNSTMAKKNFVDAFEGVVLRRMSYVMQRYHHGLLKFYINRFFFLTHFLSIIHRYQTSTILSGSNTTKTVNIVSFIF